MEEILLKEVVIVSACRTPIGKIPGSLSSIQDIDLMSMTLKEAVKRANISSESIDGVYVGCCFPHEDYNLARKALLKAGLPQSIPGATINRTCCSSMDALVQGARQIAMGDAEVILVGGVESMSNSPDTLKNIFKRLRASMKGKLPTYDSIQGDLIDEMGLATEKLARKYKISREEQDIYAVESHRKAVTSYDKDLFSDEIFSITIDEETESVCFDKDESIARDLELDFIGKEPSMYIKDGVLTRYNSSPVNDGAAAVLLMSKERAIATGLKPLAKYVTSEVCGVSPEDMGLGPVNVIQRILKKSELALEDIDAIECNEAYAAQILACQKAINWDMKKVNMQGGSIALGHPVGCSGLRICVTLVHILKRNEFEYGLATLCAGGGMGQGVLFQRG